jgi:hypothetical protein
MELGIERIDLGAPMRASAFAKGDGWVVLSTPPEVDESGLKAKE